jgi:hypothetical protein
LGRLRHSVDSQQAKFDHDFTTAWGGLRGRLALSNDSKTPNLDEPPRRRRVWRFLARTSALVLILGAGWIAGITTQERLDSDQLASMASRRMAEIGASLKTFGRGLLATLQDQTADAKEPNASATVAAAPAAAGDGDLERFRVSAAAVDGLRGTMDRVASSLDGSQRQLLARLEDFSDRLHRVERDGTETVAPVLARLDLLNERLERIERSVRIAPAPTQPAPPTSAVTPATKAAAPAQASAPVRTPQRPEKTQAPAETKKVASWVLREVIDGVAILQGPRGVIDVSVGDLVPGIGRVQSIARQGGRWIVATSKGVITAR